MAQAIRFHIPDPNTTTFSVVDVTDETSSYLEGLRRNPFRTTRGTQVFQLNTTNRRIFRYHFVLPTIPPIESVPFGIIIPEFIQFLIDTPSIDNTSENQGIYSIVQFPSQIFNSHLITARAA